MVAPGRSLHSEPLLRLPHSGCIAPSAIARYSYPNGTVLAIDLSRPFRALSMGNPFVQRLHENRHRRWAICHGRRRHLSRRRRKSPPTSPAQSGGRGGHLSRNYIPRCGKRIWREEHTNQFAGNQNDCRRCHGNGNPRIQALLRVGSSRLLRTHSCHGQREQSDGGDTPTSIRPATRAKLSPAPAGKSPIALATARASTATDRRPNAGNRSEREVRLTPTGTRDA